MLPLRKPVSPTYIVNVVYNLSQYLFIHSTSGMLPYGMSRKDTPKIACRNKTLE